MTFQNDHNVIHWKLHLKYRPETDLTLTDEGVPQADRTEVIAGWVSVLLALKASVDFDVDLRSHGRKRTWDEGFVEN